MSVPGNSAAARTTRRAVLSVAAGLVVAAQERHAHAAGALRIGYTPTIGASSLGVIDGMGWADDAGLDLQIQRFETGPAAAQALAERKIDAAFTSAVSVLQAHAAAPALRIVAGGAFEEASVVANGGFARQFASHGLKEATGIFATILGRKPRLATGMQGGALSLFMEYWLQRNGVALEAVELLPLPPVEAQTRLLNGGVDAAILQEPRLSDLRVLQPDIPVAATGRQILPDLPCTVLAVADMQAPWLDAFLRLHVRATALLSRPLAPVGRPVWKLLSGGVIALTVIDRSLAASLLRFSADPARIIDPLQRLADFQARSAGGASGAAAALVDVTAWRRVAG